MRSFDSMSVPMTSSSSTSWGKKTQSDKRVQRGRIATCLNISNDDLAGLLSPY